jgi:hypothetical protein
MNIDELSMSADVDLRANILQPSPGDLLILKVDVALTQEQRERIQATIMPWLEGMGCKTLVLEISTTRS